MLHGPAVQLSEDKSSAYKAKIGIYLFVFYLLVYTGFVVINTWKPKLMEIKVFMDLNLAVVYGFGLIILAIAAGLVYNFICTRAEDRMNGQGAE
ncbi:MAG: hypothetical protein CVV64_18110 [Candidatus Wallbacteria bacterium HGW-Wallbacteria-1]|jgi:uncharacterized membrane protein (DUF485 family)|uniref:DUF485 domain-containing protein n=1 Tax=Candidatus Wallbacteria bacterium HGW-Wallbacteria-1 TaxID=2013854 RepID=A0A2N1PJU2_9BACT|nr:MAG: hypothetical protein CVV64_18110 [Candidatus Wallbacteria bacterium HGW-Wallbacteria-1]